MATTGQKEKGKREEEALRTVSVNPEKQADKTVVHAYS